MEWENISLAFLLLASLLIAGCITAGEGEEFVYGQPLTIAAAPLIVAGEKGFWAEEGLNVKVEVFSSGRLALDANINGNLQASSVSETPPMLAVLNVHKIFIVATARKHKEAKFVGRKDKGILEPKDLVGKKIANLPGTNSDYFFSVFLSANNLSRAGIQMVIMQPPEMVSALARGDIDGFFAWEPYIYYAKNTLKENATVFDFSGLYNGYHTIIRRQEFVENEPRKAEQFLRGILRGVGFIKENREEAIGIVSRRLKMDEQDVRSLFGEYDFSMGLNSGLLDILGGEADWAIASNITTSKTPVDFRKFVFPDLLRKIDPTLVSLD